MDGGVDGGRAQRPLTPALSPEGARGEEAENNERKIMTAMEQIGELRLQARTILERRTNPEERRRPVQRIAENPDFAEVFAVILEFEEDLAASVGNYDRTEQERTMDAGGLASIRELRATLEAWMLPAAEEAKMPKTES